MAKTIHVQSKRAYTIRNKIGRLFIFENGIGVFAYGPDHDFSGLATLYYIKDIDKKYPKFLDKSYEENAMIFLTKKITEIGTPINYTPMNYASLLNNKIKIFEDDRN